MKSTASDAIAFYLCCDGDGAVGTFAFEGRPKAPGEYTYMPSRSVAHYRMIEALGTGTAVSCRYQIPGEHVVFEVIALAGYGRLKIERCEVGRLTLV